MRQKYHLVYSLRATYSKGLISRMIYEREFDTVLRKGFRSEPLEDGRHYYNLEIERKNEHTAWVLITEYTSGERLFNTNLRDGFEIIYAGCDPDEVEDIRDIALASAKRADERLQTHNYLGTRLWFPFAGRLPEEVSFTILRMRFEDVALESV